MKKTESQYACVGCGQHFFTLGGLEHHLRKVFYHGHGFTEDGNI